MRFGKPIWFNDFTKHTRGRKSGIASFVITRLNGVITNGRESVSSRKKLCSWGISGRDSSAKTLRKGISQPHTGKEPSWDLT